MDKDASATPDSIRNFFYLSDGIANGNRCIPASNGMKYYARNHVTQQHLNPSIMIDKFPEEMIKIYNLRTSDRSPLFKNYQDFVDKAAILTNNKIPNTQDLIRTQNVFTKYTKRQLSFMLKMTEKSPEQSFLVEKIMQDGIPENPLYLQASADHSGALGLSIEEIAHTEDDVCRFLRSAKQSASKPIDILTISGHGNPTSIQLSDVNDLDKSNLKKISACIKETLSDKTTIVLSACSVGKDISPDRNFAQTLATQTGLRVLAPTKDLFPSECKFGFEKNSLEPIYRCSDLVTGSNYIQMFMPES